MSQKGIIHIPIIIVFLLAAGLVVIGNVQTTTQYDDQDIQGVLISKGNSDSSGKSGSDDKREGSSDVKDEDDRSNRGSSPENRIRHEIRTSDERIKTEFREDRTRIDVYQGNTKTRFEQKGNEFVIKTEIEEDDEIEEEDEVEDEATESGEESELVQELRAISKFPLRIDLSTNQLIMTKNGVERVLTVLPAQAVQNMLRAHLKKGLGPKFFQNATPSATPEATPEGTASASPSASPTEEPIATESASLTILEGQISLEEQDGEVVYRIPSKKHLRLLGFIPITTDLTGFVSAQTGILLEERESLLSRILDLLSP